MLYISPRAWNDIATYSHSPGSSGDRSHQRCPALGSNQVRGKWVAPYMYGYTYSKGLPILHVVSETGKLNIFLSACVPENLCSRDGFGSLVSRQPPHLHTQAKYGAYYGIPSEFRGGWRPFIKLKLTYALGSVPSFLGRAIAYRWRSLPRVHRHRASS